MIIVGNHRNGGKTGDEECCEETSLLQDSSQQIGEDSRAASLTDFSRLRSNPSYTSALSMRWSQYNEYLEKHPIVVKSTTAFFLLGLGDAFAQGVEHMQGTTTDSNGLDCLRTLRFGVFGLVGAPWSHYYYDYLDSILPPTVEPFTFTTLKKVLVDQFIQAPVLLGFILIGLDIMEAHGMRTIRQDFQHHYWDTLLANCTLSVLFENVLRSFMSLPHRV